MSTRRAQRAPEGGAPQAAAPELVQELLADKRKLLVANERLRLELADERALSQGTDPRLQRLEDEVARLRGELARARMELELYEDRLNAILDLSF